MRSINAMAKCCGWLVCAATLLGSATLACQGAGVAGSVQRDIPMSAAIRRAHSAGTRDSSGRPGINYWAIRTAYTIRARLDPGTSVVNGQARVVLYNTSPTALRSIQLRLDQNRFRRRAPPDPEVPNPTDGMTLTRVSVNGEPASIGAASQRPPPALSGTRGTSERLTLARPVAPRDSVTLDFEWHFAVPLDDSTNGALRQGRLSSGVYQVAQWYPRIAMFDDLNGWDTTSYSGAVEFYNPYGRFDVRLDVPAGWLVGATGSLQNANDVLAIRTRERLARALVADSTTTIVGATEGGPGAATLPGDRLIWHFVADSVSDFAWGTSRHYIWKATRVAIPGRGPILGHMLLTPAHASNFEIAGALLRRHLASNSTVGGPYAFSQHTLLDGPESGMEYPMLTMSHGAVARLDHELAHQWFPMMVGSNETWYTFMDEGFASYLSGASVARQSGVAPSGPARSGSRTGAPLIWPDDRGPPHELFAAVYGYGKPLEMFAALETIVGRPAVLGAFGDYAKAWRFKHPSPWDFMFFMNRALGRKLDGFWYEWLFSTG